MTKAFKNFQHCGDDYYIGVKAHTTPVCETCGEKIESEPVVEVYEDNVLTDTKPVDTFKTVEEYRQNDRE